MGTGVTWAAGSEALEFGVGVSVALIGSVQERFARSDYCPLLAVGKRCIHRACVAEFAGWARSSVG